MLAVVACSCADMKRGLSRIGVWGSQSVELRPPPAGGTKATAADSAAPASPKPTTLDTKVAALRAPSKATVQQGSGELINETAAIVPPSFGDVDRGGTFSFVDTDVREVMHAVLGKMLNKNYVVDLKGQDIITLQTTRPNEIRKVLPTLESALRLNGIAIVQTDSLYRVVPMGAAMRNRKSVYGR